MEASNSHGDPSSDYGFSREDSPSGRPLHDTYSYVSSPIGGRTFAWELLLARFDHDLELIRELVDVFEPDFRIHIAHLRDAIVTHQAFRVQRISHSLRGSVSNFEDPRSVALLLELEQTGASGDLKHAPRVLEEVERAIAQLLNKLREHLG